MRGAAQERKIGGGYQFGEGGHGADEDVKETLSDRSSEHAVHKPLRRIRVAIIKTGAEEPEAPSGSVLHHVIIAGCSIRPVPPLRSDAFWSNGVGNLMEYAAPAKLSWRPFRNEGHDVSSLGLRQEH